MNVYNCHAKTLNIKLKANAAILLLLPSSTTLLQLLLEGINFRL